MNAEIAPFSFKPFSRVNWLAWIAMVSLALVSGCYQRTVAPELKYDQMQVETLEREIKRMDWD